MVISNWSGEEGGGGQELMPGSGEGEEAPVILCCFQGSACPLPSPLPSWQSAFAPPFSLAHLPSPRNLNRGRRGAWPEFVTLNLGKEALGAQCHRHPDTHKVYRPHLHPSLSKQLYFLPLGKKHCGMNSQSSSPLLLSTFPFDRHSFYSFQFWRLMNILLSPEPFKNKS